MTEWCLAIRAPFHHKPRMCCRVSYAASASVCKPLTLTQRHIFKLFILKKLQPYRKLAREVQ